MLKMRVVPSNKDNDVIVLQHVNSAIGARMSTYGNNLKVIQRSEETDRDKVTQGNWRVIGKNTGKQPDTEEGTCFAGQSFGKLYRHSTNPQR